VVNSVLTFRGIKVPMWDLTEHEAAQVMMAPEGGNLDAGWIQFWEEHFCSGDTVIDFGAHVGVISIIMVLLGANVHAVEGSPLNVKRLIRNVNPFRQIQVHQVAVSNVTEWCTTKFNDCLDHAEQEVQYVEWDNYFKLSPSFVKMDIEGMETMALHGMSRLIHKVRPVWQIEVHHDLPFKYRKYPGFVRPEDGGFDVASLVGFGYDMLDGEFKRCDRIGDPGNYFFIPK